MSKIKDVSSRMTEEMSSKINATLADLIVDLTGSPIDLNEVKRLGLLIKESDGSEVYTYDGVPLLRMWPAKVSHERDSHGFTVKVVQNYQVMRKRAHG
jgi:hypothetical protein